jgi:ferredoxin-NADP reductase
MTAAGVATRDRAAYREVEAELAVASRAQVAEGVVVVRLAAPDGGDLPEWSAGAHIDLVFDNGLTRQYSLCGSTAVRSEWVIGVLLDPQSRGGSKFVHEHLHEGATVTVRGPRNHFALAGAERYQFIAGGIGITPIRTMIEAAAARGADWQLLYGGRTRASMAFVDELSAYAERVTVHPADEHGLLPLGELLGEPRPGTLVYCCGPEPLLNAVEEACRQWPEGSLHIERFAAKQVDEPAEGALASFEVECQRSGVTVTVAGEQTIYDALEAAGIDVLGSCLEGVCGTCECEIIEGEVDHRDSVLSDADRARNDVIMICVSRSRSERLVLDI